MGVPQFSKKDFVLNLIEKKNQLEQNINNFGQVLAVVSVPSYMTFNETLSYRSFLQTHCRTITLACESR